MINHSGGPPSDGRAPPVMGGDQDEASDVTPRGRRGVQKND